MRKQGLTLYLLLCCLCFSAGLRALDLRDGAPETYVVKRGDTLWGISGMYLEKPWLWPELWDVNPQIDNPHLIYPGDELYLVWIDGQPRLRLRRGREVKLHPEMRISPLDLAIPAIPLDEIGPFLKRHRIVDAGALNGSPYVVAGDQGHLLSAPGDRIFGRGEFVGEERAYGIFRPGEAYRDPLTGELLGYHARDIGNARLLSSPRDAVVELEVTRVSEEVRIEDRLLPEEERILAATFHPRAPEQPVENGFMIAVDGGVSQIGPGHIVVLNLGQRESLEPGHVLAIYQDGGTVYDRVAQENVRLPDTRAGLLMVFEVFERASYALVLKASRPLRIMDRVEEP